MYVETNGNKATVELSRKQCAMLAYALGCMSDKDAIDTMGGELAPELKDVMATSFGLLADQLSGGEK